MVQITLEPYSSYRTSASAKFERVSSYEEYCDDCVVRLGFVKRVVKAGEEIKEPTTAEKLYDVVSQVVAETERKV